MKNIFQKILFVKNQLMKSNLKKSGFNKYSNFKYYELQDFVPQINEMCDEIGLYTEFDFTATEGILRIIDMENMESQREIRVPMAKAEIKGCNEVQNLGGSLTYLMRYLFMIAFNIMENDHFDGQDMRKKYKCEECGKDFKNVEYQDGEVTPEQQYQFCKKTFGKALCKACRKSGEYDDLIEKKLGGNKKCQDDQ